MKRNLLHSLSILVLASFLAGCGGSRVSPMVSETGQAETPASSPAPIAISTASPTPGPTATPDPCSAGLIEEQVQKIHRHMREFDDASILASNLPRDELTESVAGLQRIRREAEDEKVPACLSKLKEYQVDHMNTVINTLVAFIGGADNQTLEQGINIARRQHDDYTLELARLLGLTAVPATVPANHTQEATGTP